ncbi:MAG TPA: M23 family metallopeptidase [Acidimicrobiales bacterium]|jgi:murein DD-endopeptidase MepM/ murein hydrolase activator NlpD|nr:M23 family metallopeptidase [Acidimicrobiales bacterium]
MTTRRRRVACAVALAVLSSVGPAGPAAAALPRFAPPVEAPVSDGYRPPETPYGPGNRGWEYTTEPGTTVHAAGGGIVTFAGQVGGSLHVTVAHGGGLRTSYSFLATISVSVGTRVALGDAVGTTDTSFHFGVRLGTRYVDPAVLFRVGAFRERARLVPAWRAPAATAAGAGAAGRSATLLSRPAPG